jgi:hypothetical protein
MMKKKPTGFVAICQCGRVTGAMDLERTGHGSGRLLGEWLMNGCTVEPRFDGAWEVKVYPCTCDRAERKEGGE